MIVSYFLLVIGVRYRRPPLQVSGDAARLQAVPQPRASDLPRVCRPITSPRRLVQPFLQLALQLHTHTRVRGIHTTLYRRMGMLSHLWQVEEQVFRGPDHRSLLAHLALRILQNRHDNTIMLRWIIKHV